MRSWIELFEQTKTPTLKWHSRESCWDFEGFDVSARLLGEPDKALGIFEFSSYNSGAGNAERALHWLRTKTSILHVYDPGEPGSDSFMFWKRMCEKGLIDSIEDEDNNIIYQNGEWVDPSDGDD